MTRIKAAPEDGLRSILCLAFDSHVALRERQALEAYLIGRKEVVHALEAEGTFDFMIEAKFDGLSRYHQFIDDLVARFAPILRERCASFVCRRFIAGPDRSIWIRHNAGRVRVDLNRIERVTAEGDYVRIRVAGQDFLHHATMAAFETALDEARYVRIHRSTIVQLEAIDAVFRDRRSWRVRCRDGSDHRIARNLVEVVLRRIEAHPAIPNPGSATPATLDEKSLSQRPKAPCIVIEERPELLSL